MAARVLMATVSSVVHVPTTFSDVRRWFDNHMSLDKIDLDDQRVYKYVYHDGRFPGVFQCTSAGAQRFFKKAQPRSIIDIAMLTSIYRPGPLAANVDNLYIKAKNDGEQYDWGDGRINELLGKTYGLLIFQEGVMMLAEKVAGFPKDKCDEVRRAIMKRSISGGDAAKAKVDEMKSEFVAGAVKNGYPERVASDLYEKIAYFSGYAFNAAHATAYAIDSYYCAWLLTHHEEQWLCAYLEAMSKTPENRAEAFGYVRQMGYQIVPIDVNHAGQSWIALPGKRLMPSMSSVKGIGEGAVDELVSLRPIQSIDTMLWADDGTWRGKKFNKRALEALVRLCAFDSVGCVGPEQAFKSYRHMHHVLFGTRTEVVTRKRKGVEETVEVVRDHAALLKKSMKADPHAGLRAMYELARDSAAEFGEEWPKRVMAEAKAELFGAVDVSTMFEQAMFDRLAEKGVRPIDDLEVGREDVAWFVTALAPAKKGGEQVTGVVKLTKNRKQYVQAFVTGPSGKVAKLNVWGGRELPEPFKLCCAQVERNEFGFSTTAWKMKVVA